MSRQQFDDLLFSHSNDQSYVANEGSFAGNLSSGIQDVEHRFITENQSLLNHQDDDVSDADNENEAEENEKQFRENKNYQLIFPDVNGPSYNCNDCSQNSMSMSKRIDDFQTRQSEKSEHINITKLLANKKKEEYIVNQVIGTEVQELLDEQEKYKVIIEGYKKKEVNYQEEIKDLKRQNDQLEQRNHQYFLALQKKDELFVSLRETCSISKKKLQDKEKEISEILNLNHILEEEVDRLRKVIDTYTDQERNLTDFRSLTPKRNQEKASFKSTVDKELQKMKKEKCSLETEYQILKDQLCKKQTKFKAIEEELKRKVSMKQKKIKELEEGMTYAKEEISKTKKNSDNSLTSVKQRMYKMEKEVSDKDERIQEMEKRNKLSLQESKKKEEKINHILFQISQKNKKINQLSDKLREEEARNAIESKIQVQRENQIEKLQKQIKTLKNEKSTLERKISSTDKEAGVQIKLKKEIAQLKMELEGKQEEIEEQSNENYMLRQQNNEKDKKIKELKKKNEEISKKANSIKLKTSEKDQMQLQINNYKEKITKLNKELNECKKKLEENHQEMANRQYIIESMKNMKPEEQNNSFEYENQFNFQEQIEALEMAVQERDREIKKLKYSHKMELQRYEQEIQTLKEIIDKKQGDLEFRQSSLNYIHKKYIELEKEKAELQMSKNILHSSFYDQSHDDSDKFEQYEERIEYLTKLLRQRQIQIQKMMNNEKNLEKNKIKEAQYIALENSKKHKLAPESLSPEETMEFLLKTMKRVMKSVQMIKMLSKLSDFREIIFSMHKLMERRK